MAVNNSNLNFKIKDFAKKFDRSRAVLALGFTLIIEPSEYEN